MGLALRWHGSRVGVGRKPSDQLLLTIQSDIEHIWQLSYRGGFYRGGPVLMSALSGVDIALWDLKGKYDWSASSWRPVAIDALYSQEA
jgi:L-alanine-DL-glutamate epimerase-like enolase superfamily enzyme